MEEWLGPVIVVVLVVGLAEVYGVYRAHTDPATPDRKTDPTRDEEAIVAETFLATADETICSGKVTLNGALWLAEHHAATESLQQGQRVRSVERRGLTLIVEPLP
ncbi:MAG: NfeD family protein [Pseudomonadota bacterium]